MHMHIGYTLFFVALKYLGYLTLDWPWVLAALTLDFLRSAAYDRVFGENK